MAKLPKLAQLKDALVTKAATGLAQLPQEKIDKISAAIPDKVEAKLPAAIKNALQPANPAPDVSKLPALFEFTEDTGIHYVRLSDYIKDDDALAFSISLKKSSGLFSFDNTTGMLAIDTSRAVLRLGETLTQTYTGTATDLDAKSPLTTPFTLNIKVTGVNDAPEALGNTIIVGSAREDTGQNNFDVRAFFADQDGDTLTYTVVNPAAGFTLSSEGMLTLDTSDPAYNYLVTGNVRNVGPTISVSDGRTSVTSTLQVQLFGEDEVPPPPPPNNAPVGPASQVMLGDITEDTGVQTFDLKEWFTDPDMDVLHFSLIRNDIGLQLSQDGLLSVDTDNPFFDHLDAGESATMVGVIRAYDGSLAAVSSVSLTLNGVTDAPPPPNRAPTGEVSLGGWAENGGIRTFPEAKLNIVDPDGDTLVFAPVSMAPGLTIQQDGTLVWNFDDPGLDNIPTGQLTYQWSTATADDGHGHVYQFTIKAIVLGVDDAEPVIQTTAASTDFHI